MCLRKPLLTIILLLILSSAGPTNADDVTHICNDCHQSPAPTTNNLKQPLPQLCADCHTARLTIGEHAVNIPIQNTTILLPTQDGNITCSTCHDHHDASAALRLPEPDLCRICHKQ